MPAVPASAATAESKPERREIVLFRAFTERPTAS